LEGKTLILVDPMLATGTSLVYSYEALVAKGGNPKELHVAAVIASEAGVEYKLINVTNGKSTL
jgi:uracil phosphoribosyltransferase